MLSIRRVIIRRNPLLNKPEIVFNKKEDLECEMVDGDYTWLILEASIEEGLFLPKGEEVLMLIEFDTGEEE